MGEGGMERIASRWGTAAKEGDERKKEREKLDQRGGCIIIGKGGLVLLVCGCA